MYGLRRVNVYLSEHTTSPLGASAVVHWKLRERERVSTGIDRFTIIRTDENVGKIISLTYYETDF